MHDEPGSAGSATPTDDQAEVLATGQPGGRGEHGASGSGREAGAALAPAGGQDRAARASPHPQPEPMGLGATTVVGLEGALTLAHFWVSRCSLQAGLVVSPAALTRSPHYTAAPDENRGRRVMFRHSLARARKDARYQRETIREYAAARRFSNRLRCALARHTIRRQTGHGRGVTGRFGLWRPPRLVSVLPRGFDLGTGPRLPHVAPNVRAEPGPRRWPTQCEAPMCPGVPSCTVVDNLWTTCPVVHSTGRDDLGL